MREGGRNGSVLVPGKSEASLLLDHILERNGLRRMPPPSEGEALKPEQVAKIRLWIDRGASAPADETPEADPRDHWAFRAPTRPAIPEANGTDGHNQLIVAQTYADDFFLTGLNVRENRGTDYAVIYEDRNHDAMK